MSEQVLYRKYRPQTFGEVVGQEHVTRFLKNAVISNRIAHAYLFSGPRGTGKTSVARLLAKAANCTKFSGKQKSSAGTLGVRQSLQKADGGAHDIPCNVCDMCKEFSTGSVFDLIEIDAASSRGIDDIRELRDAVRFSPVRAAYKAYIIDEVHMLTKEAFNALLKTLEEPPAHTIFILATTEFQKVPETIVSRTQHYEFRKIPAAAIRDCLSSVVKKEGVTAEKDALRLLSIFADGGLRDAESMLGQVLSGRDALTVEDVRLVLGAPKEELVHMFVSSLFEKNASGAAHVVQTAIEEGTDPQMYLKMIIRNVRHALLARIDPHTAERLEGDLTEAEQEFLKTAEVKAATVLQLEHMLRSLIDAYWMSYRTVYPQLPLELAIVEILRDSFINEKEEVKEV